MSDKLPALQFYVGDWRKDPGVQALDYEAKGVWLEILLLMHESEKRGQLLLNGKAMTNSALARNLGLPEAKTKRIVSKIEAYGVASRDPKTGVLYCRRMVRDENLRLAKVEAGRKGGSISRPPAKKQDASKAEAEHEANGGSSVSVAVSSSVSKTPPTPYENEFLVFWGAYPLKIGKKDALQAYQARRRQGVSDEDLTAGLARYLKWATATGTRLKHPATFLGPKEWWAEPWHIPEAKATGEKRGNGPGEFELDPKFKKPFEPIITERVAHKAADGKGGNVQIELPERDIP